MTCQHPWKSRIEHFSGEIPKKSFFTGKKLVGDFQGSGRAKNLVLGSLELIFREINFSWFFVQKRENYRESTFLTFQIFAKMRPPGTPTLFSFFHFSREWSRVENFCVPQTKALGMPFLLSIWLLGLSPTVFVVEHKFCVGYTYKIVKKKIII